MQTCYDWAFFKQSPTSGTSQPLILSRLVFYEHLVSSVRFWFAHWHLGHLGLHASWASAAPWVNCSSIIVIISSFNRPCRSRPSKAFVSLKGNVTFSAPLSQVKNKDWRLRAKRSNWDVSTTGGALKNYVGLGAVTEALIISQTLDR